MTILFVCIHNSGRSQMAEAFLNSMAQSRTASFDQLSVKGISAGTQPADQVNPIVAEVMKEVGIDISRNKPKALTLEMIEHADRMITMGCGDDPGGLCPAKIIETEDWVLEDPKGQPIEKVRQIRDEVRRQVEKLLRELATGE